MNTRRGFTLIELLVVIAIIALLVSILVPSLRHAQVLAGVVACQVQMRTVTLGLLQYVDDYDNRLPYTRTLANPSTCQMFPFPPKDKPPYASGFACLYADRYVEDHRTFYCPTAKVISAWTGGSLQQYRQNMIDSFQTKFEQKRDFRVDYNLGWWTEQNPNSWSTPSGLRTDPTLDRYLDYRRIWMVDGVGVFPYYYKIRSHADAEYMNFASVDGTVRYVQDYAQKQKDGGATYYWPYNDRPGWSFWSYWGRELQ